VINQPDPMKSPIILVVDDSLQIRRLLEKSLATKGYIVVSFSDGEQLLAYDQLKNADLILLDQVMPVISGMDTYKRLAKLPDTPPCIMLTGDESQALAVEFMRLGGADFLQKPFDMAVLDLSARRAIEENRLRDRLTYEEQARQAAEESNRLKDEFLANISHELRTPLHGIIGFTDKALNRFGDQIPEKLHRYLVVIQQSGERLRALMDNMLELVKLDSKDDNFRPKKVRLDQLVQMEVGAKGPELSNKSQTIEVSFPSVVPLAYGDTTMIVQLLDQILSNAVKFSPENSVITLKVESAGLKRGGKTVQAVTVQCLDQGPGVPERELESIFEKFTQSSLTNTGSGGTGLGLAIAKAIVEKHSGVINISNRPTGGCCASFTLPSAAE